MMCSEANILHMIYGTLWTTYAILEYAFGKSKYGSFIGFITWFILNQKTKG